MEIRQIRRHEEGFLKEILYEALFVEEGEPKLHKSIINDPSLSKYIDDFGLNKFDVCLVAVKEKELIGAVWGRLFNEQNKGYGFIDEKTPELSIAVKERFRNKGIGTKLISKIIEEYKNLNIASVSLSVDKKNAAIRLYYKLGFKIMRDTKTSCVMQLNL